MMAASFEGRGFVALFTRERLFLRFQIRCCCCLQGAAGLSGSREAHRVVCCDADLENRCLRGCSGSCRPLARTYVYYSCLRDRTLVEEDRTGETIEKNEFNARNECKVLATRTSQGFKTIPKYKILNLLAKFGGTLQIQSPE